MVKHERVAESVYFFQSEEYAEVNAGVVIGTEMAAVIDTLAYPEETAAIIKFVEEVHQTPIKYVINTHYHADHTWGNCFFKNAEFIAHAKCKENLIKFGMPALEQVHKANAFSDDVKIILPDITFSQGRISFKLGKKTVTALPLPGHTNDNIGIFVEEDKVLFAGDTVMPVPFIVDGDIEETISSLETLPLMGIENIVQGHGEIILRGEVNGMVEQNVEYLRLIEKTVMKANRRKFPLDLIESVTIADAQKDRTIMGGIAESLHQRNMISLYQKKFNEEPIGSEIYFT
ncbi:MAG: MBL fold metallo-hydrolase [Candidatus Heimdallarchaeota archaeon]|nr:MBL fold metallo-hydrolase [Candidatus Heimdallarchaeota archaeon]